MESTKIQPIKQPEEILLGREIFDNWVFEQSNYIDKMIKNYDKRHLDIILHVYGSIENYKICLIDEKVRRMKESPFERKVRNIKEYCPII